MMRSETGAVDAAADGWVADLDLPVMLLHDDAVEHNLRVMADYCRDAGVELAPHAKTHLSAALCRRQAAAGAWGFTVATPAQVKVLHGLGAGRILHANVLVDRSMIGWVAEHLLVDGAPEYLCYVDSTAGLDLLVSELGRVRPARPLRVLLELGFPGGRTGVRDDAVARDLARRVAASDGLALAGVSGYEGLMPAGDDPAEPVGAVGLLRRVRGLVTELADAGLVAGLGDGVPVVTAGGSSYFDLVVRELGPQVWDRPVRTVLRSGCYLTHDHGVYRRTSPFGTDRGTGALRAALELRASVLSVPEDGRAVVGFGRREAPTDDRLPVVLGVVGPPGAAEVPVDGWEITGVNDHHAYLRLPRGTDLAPGTVLRLGVSHPCGAFDRWRRIPLVGGADQVLGEIRPLL